MSKTLLEQMKENGALEVTSTIERMLKEKTRLAIDETRKQVAAETFGMTFETVGDSSKLDEQIDAAYNNEQSLNEGKEPDHALAKDLADKALYNHNQFHAGNHDEHHGGWAMHDLHTWAKNYAKKSDKGTYDKEKAVKGLTHAVKNSEPGYFGRGHMDRKAPNGKISGATRTQAARHLLPHVEKMMAQHTKKPMTTNEAEKPKAKPAGQEKERPMVTRKPHPKQGEFNKQWASADDEGKKHLKKIAWHHDFDIPDMQSHQQSHGGSMAHLMSKVYGENTDLLKFGEMILEEVQGIPYPAKSKHLKDYKPTSDSDHEMHLDHPAGHKLVWHKGDNTFTHTTPEGKVKKGKMGDLHPHLSKVHHDFDGKVKQHMRDHMHDAGSGLLHKMGALAYAHKNHPEGRDHEDDSINQKAMRSAYLKLTKRERGVK
jgi:hypothetical protein